MINSDIFEKYKVSDEELNSIITLMKEQMLFNHRNNYEIPTAIFTGGQPGAGKTRIVSMSKSEMEKSNKAYLVFDLDLYRNLLSISDEIIRKYPEYYQYLTGSYAGKIMEELSKTAIENDYNFIMEGTMGRSTYTIDYLLSTKKKYKIIARLLAVSYEESLTSIFERYILMIENGEYGRFTPIKQHNELYENFLNVVSTLEERGIEVEVYIRSNDTTYPKIIYKTSQNIGMDCSLLEAIQYGREISREKYYQTYMERLNNINEKLRGMNINKNLEEELNELNRIFNYPSLQKVKKIQ